ncbi:hypothetical protein CPS_0534 [Colwellia psychrerythraea 34H]|uniref:Uncharacterized protein n=1 Tax=Colwellia psychrerythraea (strain 34H / ATCC BAA-681) TaxID=167879 RepID=Q489H2_COLP3|nr:hypothetical protein CPS_0534 [Colwellia psychrerythraea 34H]
MTFQENHRVCPEHPKTAKSTAKNKLTTFSKCTSTFSKLTFLILCFVICDAYNLLSMNTFTASFELSSSNAFSFHTTIELK